MQFHAECCLFEMICLEAIISLAFNAFKVHFNCLLWLFGMLVAISSLLKQLFCIVFTVLFCVEHVAEETAFEGCFGLRAELSRFRHKVCFTECFYHCFIVIV